MGILKGYCYIFHINVYSVEWHTGHLIVNMALLVEDNCDYDS